MPELIQQLKHSRPDCPFSSIYNLDTEVSGPVLFAKTLEARKFLRNAYGSDAFILAFEALGWLNWLFGVDRKPCPEQWICDLSIAWDAVKQRSYPSKTLGKKSCTHFVLSETYGSYGYFTGFTHYLRPQQIQVHAHFSHYFDIVGDTLWIPDAHYVYPPHSWKTSKPNEPIYPALHLAFTTLSFPFNGEIITLHQDSPKAWISVEKVLKNNHGNR